MRRIVRILFIFVILKQSIGQYTVVLQSPQYASLGSPYQLTCIVEPHSGSVIGVTWYRNNGSDISVGQVGSNDCRTLGTLPQYNYTCGTQTTQLGEYMLTILNVSSSEDNVAWRCRTLTQPYVDSNRRTISVVFPVRHVIISSIPVDATPVNAVDGVPQTFKCTPDSAALHPVSCFWYKGDRYLGISALQTDIALSKGENITVTCKCNNSVPSTLYPASSKPVNILIAPVLRKLSNQRIIEGQRLKVTCSVIESNPPVTTYSWTRNGQSVGSQEILEYASIFRNQAGIYNCTASNTMKPTNGPTVVGIASQTMDVNVLYKPNITAVYIDGGQHDVTEGTRVVITALIDSNPDQYEVQWIDEGNDKVLQTESRIQHQSYLFLNSAHCLNTTTYSVTVVNEVGTSNKSVSLNVTCLPKIDHRYILPKTIRISIGSNLYVPFRYLSNPPLKSCVWIFKPNNESSSQTKELSSSGKTLVINSKLSSVEYVSILSITHITAKNFGVYSVVLQQYNGDRQIFHYNVSETTDEVQFTTANRCTCTTMFVVGAASAFGLLSIVAISYLIIRKYRGAAKARKQEIEERYDSIEIHHKGPSDEYSTISPEAITRSSAALTTGAHDAETSTKKVFDEITDKL